MDNLTPKGLERLEVLVPTDTKIKLKFQSKLAVQPAKIYCGQILAQKADSFEDAASLYLKISIKLDALIGAINANKRHETNTTGQTNAKPQAAEEYQVLLNLLGQLCADRNSC